MKENAKNTLATAQYCPLKEALTHNWAGMTRRQTKELNPAVVFTVLGAFFSAFTSLPFSSAALFCYATEANERFTAIWEFQAVHEGKLPSDIEEADELEAIVNKMIKEANVNKQILTVAPRDLIEYVSPRLLSSSIPFTADFRSSLCLHVSILVFLWNVGCVNRTMATTAFAEFSPVCAVVGGLLAQDILKALGAREAPLANFFTFDGNTGSGTVVRMKMAGP